MLLTFIYFQWQCVNHLFSMSMCNSFNKCGSPVGFLLSAYCQRLFGWLRFFKLNISFVFNLFSFCAGFFNALLTSFNV